MQCQAPERFATAKVKETVMACVKTEKNQKNLLLLVLVFFLFSSDEAVVDVKCNVKCQQMSSVDVKCNRLPLDSL